MTRYPGNDPANKGKQWTIKALDAITVAWKGDTLSDGGGLVGDIRANADGVISIAFKYGFKLNGKKVWHYCGTYPDRALADIRQVRDDAKALLPKGIDPRVKKITDKIEEREKSEAIFAREEKRKSESLTVEDIFDAWVADGVKRADNNKYIIQSFKKHALPVLGNIKINQLSEHDLRTLYRSIIDCGKNATAVELSKDLKQMLNWAEKRQPWRALLIDGNPADLVEINKLLPSDYKKERERILSLDEIKKLKLIFDNTTKNYTDATKKYETERPLKKEVQIAMWLCLSTLCRIGELLMTEWKHIDFEARTWFIPAANTKGERGHKRDQLVYLSDFSIDQFKQLEKLTSDTPWAFPARFNEGHVCVKSASKQIGDRQVMYKKRNKKLKYRVENNSLVLGGEEWTPHDLRRTGATMMQELKVPLDVIDRCQNHVIAGSRVRRHYLHYEYADEKREAWQKLGNRLGAILNASNVVSLKSA